MFSCHLTFNRTKEDDSRTPLLRTRDDQGKPKVITTRTIIWGVLLAYSSSLLYDASFAINKKLHLNFSDTLLSIYVIQSLVCALAILLFNYKQTKKQGKCKNNDSDEANLTSINEISEKIAVWITNVDDDKNVHIIRCLLLLQGVSGPLMTLSAYIAVSLLPFGDAMSIVFTSPLTAMILAFLFIGQRLRLYKISAALCIWAGIVLIVQPSFLFQRYETITSEKNISQMDRDRLAHIESYVVSDGYYLFGVLSASLSSVFLGSESVIIGYLSSNKSTNSAFLMIIYQGVLGISVALICSSSTGEQMLLSKDIVFIDAYYWLGLFLSGLCTVVAIFVGTISIQMIGPVLQSFVRTSGLINAYVIQVIFFSDSLDPVKIVGAGCILIAILALPFEDTVVRKMPEGILQTIF